ncbi:MAG: hypothetical protein Q8P18_33205 [Pseudomonadota bacterium]|nr:hypothetical protein [Pseudomonadota bacterium]
MVIGNKLHVRLRPHQKALLQYEADQRGVEVASLVRAVIDLHLDAVHGEILGWITESVTIMQIRREETLEQVAIPRRRLRRMRNE